MKIGILGSGYIATKIAEAIRVLDEKGYGVKAYAIASRSIEKAKQFASDFHFEKAYGSYEELAQDKEVDLIYVATPHSEHYSNIKLCLKYGKNLLVEKAFTANLLQASEVITSAREKGVFLCEAMWTRFLPGVQCLKEWLVSGKIGKIQTVEANFSIPISHVERLRNPSLAGGALLDLGIYGLTFADLVLSKIGDSENSVIQIFSQSVLLETGVDGTDWVTLSYRNGERAFIKTSIQEETRNEGIVYGTKGIIRVENINDFVSLKRYDLEGNLLESFTPRRLCNAYEYELLACKKAMEKGLKECHEMPLDKTLELMKQMDSIRQNAQVVYPFEQSPNEIWDRSHDKSFLKIFDIETGKITLLKEFDKVIEAPNWSADGTFLTYNSEGRIYKYEIESGKEECVPSHYVDNCNNDHVLSPDGLGLFVSHHTKEDGLSRIYKIFFDGSLPKLVTPLAPSYLHGVTPDGKNLAYCACRQGEYDIYTIPAEGGNETRLTSAKGLNDGSEYDSKGEWIWFNSVRSGRMQAFCMKADGSEQTQMTFDLHWNTWFPHISPDLKKVVMLAYQEVDVCPGDHIPNKNVELRLMKLSENGWSEPQTILKLFGGQGTINVNSWAPDSRRFAFVSYEKKQ